MSWVDSLTETRDNVSCKTHIDSWANRNIVLPKHCQMYK